MLSVRSRPLRVLALAIAALFILTILYQCQSLLPRSSRDAPKPRPGVRPTPDLAPEYTPESSDSPWCQERFGVKFLENARDAAVSYCTPSSPSLSCFWSTTTEGRRDAMCHGQGATYDAGEAKFRLGCRLRDLSRQETQNHTPHIPDGLTRYWYDTGPRHVFDQAVLLDESARVQRPRTTSILVKREGPGNLWHVLMELISLSWTLDVLQISQDADSREPHLPPAAASSTQVIFVDGYEDGPFVDMWRLFAKLPIRRIHQLDDSEPATNIIIPFAGGSNTLWQGDWVELDCRESALVKTFVSRVLRLYNIPAPARRSRDVVARFIRRASTRRLINETELIESARRAVPHLNLEAVDFAGLSFAQQLTIVSETDLLIGVHGAGLSHTMFLPPGSAVVEILPGDFAHMGFRNLAQMLGHRYYRTHGAMHGDASGDSQWQFDAVEMEEGRFVRLIDTAVRGLYSNGMRTYDTV